MPNLIEMFGVVLVMKCADRHDLYMQQFCVGYVTSWLSHAVHNSTCIMNVSAFLVRQLELKACRLNADTTHVHSTMVALDVPLMTLMDVYER
jgi:hypothetical protein